MSRIPDGVAGRVSASPYPRLRPRDFEPGHTGSYISGFNNTAVGVTYATGISVAGGISGFNNVASGAVGALTPYGYRLAESGLISGLNNTGVTGAFNVFASGIFSGIGSGLFNANTAFSGLFNIDKAA